MTKGNNARLKTGTGATTTHPLTPTDTDPATNCPPDVALLGRHTWTFLHALTASYPTQASRAEQDDMRAFLGLFARLYPCWTCAADFQAWMATEGRQPRVGGRAEFGRWMCEAHNEVNGKLGKPAFDCDMWERRWRTGEWRDGRCG
ncbi:MAG: hypothetical protein M1826_005200 [Phylliscum demangeonii]|nr:MAG: hypothetical protein M1826_005200 [Phylliscum demangeonii]